MHLKFGTADSNRYAAVTADHNTTLNRNFFYSFCTNSTRCMCTEINILQMTANFEDASDFLS